MEIICEAILGIDSLNVKGMPDGVRRVGGLAGAGTGVKCKGLVGGEQDRERGREGGRAGGGGRGGERGGEEWIA